MEDYQDQVKNGAVRISCLRCTINSQNKFSNTIFLTPQLSHISYILQLQSKRIKCVQPVGHGSQWSHALHSLQATTRHTPSPVMPAHPLFIHHSQPENTGLCVTSLLASDSLTGLPIPSRLQAVHASGWPLLFSLPGALPPNPSVISAPDPPSGRSSFPSDHLLVLILVSTWPQSDQYAPGLLVCVHVLPNPHCPGKLLLCSEFATGSQRSETLWIWV